MGQREVGENLRKPQTGAELGGEVAAALAASGSAADTVDKESDNHDALFLEHIPHLRKYFLHPAKVQDGIYATPQEPGSSSDFV